MCRVVVYNSSREFLLGTASWPNLLKQAFVRDSKKNVLPASMLIWGEGTPLLACLRCLPGIGSALGFSRLYSVWSTKDPRDGAQTSERLVHTIYGFLELCGLGILKASISVICIVLLLVASLCIDFVSMCLRKDERIILTC